MSKRHDILKFHNLTKDQWKKKTAEEKAELTKQYDGTISGTISKDGTIFTPNWKKNINPLTGKKFASKNEALSSAVYAIQNNPKLKGASVICKGQVFENNK